MARASSELKAFYPTGMLLFSKPLQFAPVLNIASQHGLQRTGAFVRLPTSLETKEGQALLPPIRKRLLHM
ncbi:uncharacterized protein LAJ45_08941 [Morchella importuna]|uniref:uncharacterized protein n=1 Tax=Morchella importuna TaxID=1174673 RepID=UPI001E8E45D0|nr:uncharacterized protein LAJ45_08941 [Morchella importuna]KAH8147141.1 hypothetical protein LAJ45_08941 [Morchella importuna]